MRQVTSEMTRPVIKSHRMYMGALYFGDVNLASFNAESSEKNR